MSAAAISAGSSPTNGRRRIQRVTESMVAAAQAQVQIAGRLGKTVPPAISKIAKVKPRTGG